MESSLKQTVRNFFEFKALSNWQIVEESDTSLTVKDNSGDYDNFVITISSFEPFLAIITSSWTTSKSTSTIIIESFEEFERYCVESAL